MGVQLSLLKALLWILFRFDSRWFTVFPVLSPTFGLVSLKFFKMIFSVPSLAKTLVWYVVFKSVLLSSRIVLLCWHHAQSNFSASAHQHLFFLPGGDRKSGCPYFSKYYSMNLFSCLCKAYEAVLIGKCLSIFQLLFQSSLWSTVYEEGDLETSDVATLIRGVPGRKRASELYIDRQTDSHHTSVASKDWWKNSLTL